MFEHCERDGHLWRAALEAKFEGKGKTFTRMDWDALLGDCQAVTDRPCAAFAEELLSAYPQALVILTTRDSMQQWIASVKRLEALHKPYAPSRLSAFLQKLLLPVQAGSNDAGRALDIVHRYSDVGKDPESSYGGHNDRVRRLCAREGRQLLEFNVKEGWGPLCEYLGHDVPNEPFPGTHFAADEEQELARNVRERNALMLRDTTACLGTLFALAFGIYKIARFDKK